MPDNIQATGALDIQFPEKLQFLFSPTRYKIAYGGRGSAKSWGFARALIIKAAQEKLQILCARELQASMEESVHRLLEQQITLMGLGHLFKVEKMHIYSNTGSVFSFEGISRNVNKIKSYEGVDICWIEEAAKVSRNSWNVLIPTIRKPGSEIWATLNPELETDEAVVRFIQSPPKDCVSIKMNWQDNPWFPEVLRSEMDSMKERDFDEYLHVWEGHCRANLQGAVYAKEMRNALADGRITRVPYSKEAPVDTFWDLGRRDMTSIWFAQRVGLEYRVIDFFEDSMEHIEYYIRALQGKPYMYGIDHLPHDAKAKTIGTKRSVEEIMKAAGRKVKIVPKLSVTDGINAARGIFPSLYFDEVKCADGLQHLRRYRYDVANEGTLSINPVHDEHSHCADAFRYLGVALRPPKEKKKLNLWSGEHDMGSAGLGWMR